MKSVYALSGLALGASAAALPAQSVKTIYSTEYATVTSCGPSVTNCPAKSTVVSSVVHSLVVTPASACVTSLFDGCNPARSSCPNGPGTFVTVTPSTYPTSYFIGCNPARSSCANGPGQFVTLTQAPSVCASSTPAPSAPASAPAASACVTTLFDGCNPARSSCPNGPGSFVTVTPSTYPTSYFIGCNPARSSCSNGPGQFVTLTKAPSVCLSSSTPAPTAPATTQASSTPAASKPAASACVTSLFDGCNPARSSCPNGPGSFVTVTPSSYPTSYFIGCNPARSSCSNGPGQFVTLTQAPSVCASSTPAPSAPASTPAASKSTGSGSACQTSLTGAYETPHAIIPVDKSNPGHSYGTQYFANINSDNSTIFNFDIPYSVAGKQCSIIFLFPTQAQLETSSFTESGSGGLVFEHLKSAAGLDATFQSAPAVDAHLATIDGVKPGNSYHISSGACAPGTKQSIKVSSKGGYSLNYFQDWNPSPIGLFVTTC